MERYALLWVFAAAVLICLAAWPNGLKVISDAAGIFYPPTTLFIVAFVFVLLLLLHFSAVVSRLGDQTTVLAQRVALLEQRLRRLETDAARGARAGGRAELEGEPDYAVLERESARGELTRAVRPGTARGSRDRPARAPRSRPRALGRSHPARSGIAAISPATRRRSSGVRATQRTSGDGSSWSRSSIDSERTNTGGVPAASAS